VITGILVASLVELPWPARLRPVSQVIRARAFAGVNAGAAVEYRIDDGPWRPADLALGSTGWGDTWPGLPPCGCGSREAVS
jgi:hypothetical protein